MLFAAHPEVLTPVLRIVHPAIATFLIQQAALKHNEAYAYGKTEHIAHYENGEPRQGRRRTAPTACDSVGEIYDLDQVVGPLISVN